MTRAKNMTFDYRDRHAAYAVIRQSFVSNELLSAIVTV